MTSLIGAKRRAEEFAAALEGDAAWSDVHPELAELAGVVDTLRAHDPVAPSVDFTARLRERLVTEAEGMRAQDALLTLPPRRRTRERRFTVAVSALVLVGGSAGMAAAAQQALPGEALYPIKRGLEKAQTGLATSDEAKGRDLLDQADTRLREIQQMLEGSTTSSQLPSTIDTFTVQARDGAKLLMDSYASNNDPQAIAALRSFAARDIAVLQEVAGSAPADQQAELTSAAMALLSIDARALDACPGCAPDLPALQMPRMFAVSADVARALSKARRQVVNNDHPPLNATPAPLPATENNPSPGPSGNSGGGDHKLLGLPTGGGSGDGGSDGGSGGGVDGGTGGSGGSGDGGAGTLRGTVGGTLGGTLGGSPDAGGSGGGGLLPKGDGSGSLVDTLLP